jgi:hypothetical protein
MQTVLTENQIEARREASRQYTRRNRKKIQSKARKRRGSVSYQNRILSTDFFYGFKNPCGFSCFECPHADCIIEVSLFG